MPALFQSRNRDAFHFRSGAATAAWTSPSSFNLAIEMLFISGHLTAYRFCSVRRVSISQSRCFSFQVTRRCWRCALSLFQSRNRDAFHFRFGHTCIGVGVCQSFNLAIEMLFISGNSPREMPVVSRCFNLAIEMLFISGNYCHRQSEYDDSRFQSRNRDAFHFRYE